MQKHYLTQIHSEIEKVKTLLLLQNPKPGVARTNILHYIHTHINKK